MRTRVQKWGNSLALRIPKTFATEVGLADDTLVEVTLVDGTLVIAPLPASDVTLESLLAGITDDNLHGETETGAMTGNEAW